MDKGGEQQMMKKPEEKDQRLEGKKPEEKDQRLEGLPTETSPYTQYKDVEDYKRQGYGTQGHQEPKAGRGGGSTDAPTLSGNAAQETQLFPPTSSTAAAGLS